MRLLVVALCIAACCVTHGLNDEASAVAADEAVCARLQEARGVLCAELGTTVPACTDARARVAQRCQGETASLGEAKGKAKETEEDQENEDESPSDGKNARNATGTNGEHGQEEQEENGDNAEKLQKLQKSFERKQKKFAADQKSFLSKQRNEKKHKKKENEKTNKKKEKEKGKYSVEKAGKRAKQNSVKRKGGAPAASFGRGHVRLKPVSVAPRAGRCSVRLQRESLLGKNYNRRFFIYGSLKPNNARTSPKALDPKASKGYWLQDATSIRDNQRNMARCKPGQAGKSQDGKMGCTQYKDSLACASSAAMKGGACWTGRSVMRNATGWYMHPTLPTVSKAQGWNEAKLLAALLVSGVHNKTTLTKQLKAASSDAGRWYQVDPALYDGHYVDLSKFDYKDPLKADLWTSGVMEMIDGLITTTNFMAELYPAMCPLQAKPKRCPRWLQPKAKPTTRRALGDSARWGRRRRRRRRRYIRRRRARRRRNLWAAARERGGKVAARARNAAAAARAKVVEKGKKVRERSGKHARRLRKIAVEKANKVQRAAREKANKLRERTHKAKARVLEVKRKAHEKLVKGKKAAARKLAQAKEFAKKKAAKLEELASKAKSKAVELAIKAKRKALELKTKALNKAKELKKKATSMIQDGIFKRILKKLLGLVPLRFRDMMKRVIVNFVQKRPGKAFRVMKNYILRSVFKLFPTKLRGIVSKVVGSLANKNVKGALVLLKNYVVAKLLSLVPTKFRGMKLRAVIKQVLGYVARGQWGKIIAALERFAIGGGNFLAMLLGKMVLAILKKMGLSDKDMVGFIKCAVNKIGKSLGVLLSGVSAKRREWEAKNLGLNLGRLFSFPGIRMIRMHLIKQNTNVDDRFCRPLAPLLRPTFVSQKGNIGYFFKSGYQLAREGKTTVNVQKSAGDALVHIKRMGESKSLEGCSYVSRMSFKVCSTCCCKKGPVVLSVQSAACESGNSPLCQQVPKLKRAAPDCEVWFAMVDSIVRWAANWQAVQQTYYLHQAGTACQKKDRNGHSYVSLGSTGCLDGHPKIRHPGCPTK